MYGPPEIQIQRPLAKLSRTGLQILEEYLINHPHDTNPSTITLKSLLEQVQKAQNNFEIKRRTVTSWFRRQRDRAQAPAHHSRESGPTPNSPTSPTILFSEENLENIHSLVQATPEPSLQLLQTWAKLLRVSVSDLQYVITTVLPARSSKAPQTTISQEQTIQLHNISFPSISSTPRVDSRSQRLLTPADSLTPEPSPTEQRSLPPKFLKYEPDTPMSAPESDCLPSDKLCHTPIPQDNSCGKEALPCGGHVPGLGMDQSCGLQPSPPMTPVVPFTSHKDELSSAPHLTTESPKTVFQPRISPLQNAIYLGIQKACVEALSAKSIPCIPPPKTTSESDTRFAHYQKTLERLSLLLGVNPSPSTRNSATGTGTLNS